MVDEKRIARVVGLALGSVFLAGSFSKWLTEVNRQPRPSAGLLSKLLFRCLTTFPIRPLFVFECSQSRWLDRAG